MEDIRWKQRFSNYQKALNRLYDNVIYATEELQYETENLPDIIKQGLIQSFEFTHELAWKVIKDYAEYQGNTEIRGSRDAVRYAAQVGLISNGELWITMIFSRNKTSHTYDEDTANEIVTNIVNAYLGAFVSFKEKMETLIDE